MNRAPTPRRWFAGYTVVVVATVAQILTAPGQTVLVSLLNLPLRAEFGLDALSINVAYTLATITASLPLVLVGRLTDRFGPRKMMAAVALAFGAACVFMASVQSFVAMCLGFFLLRFLGQGSLSLVSHHAMAMWFHRRLGTLTGLKTVALFAVWAPLPALTQACIDGIGWRSTWAVYGVVVAVVVAGLALTLLHDRPEALGLHLDGDDAAEDPSAPSVDLRGAQRTGAFWLLTAGMALSAMIGTAVLFDMQPLVLSKGLPREDAAELVGVWTLTMAAMALPSGRLVDRATPAWVLGLGSTSVGLGCAGLLWTSSYAGAFAAVLTLAVGQSLLGTVVTTATARFFGREHHGSIRSALNRVAVISTGLGPLAFGLSDRMQGSYDVALVAFVALCIPVTIGAAWLRMPSASPTRA